MTKRLFPIAFLLLTAFVFVGCSNEEENLFDHSAAERLNEVSKIYTQRLSQSKGGWVMEYYPYSDNEDLLTGRGYIIMNRFNTDGSVYTMMKNSLTRNVAQSDLSAFEVITDMGPVLTYNTYNKNLGVFTDPYDIPSSESDESGKGYQGDYEFVMVDVPENGQHIMLKGKKRGVYQRLSRIPEGTDFEEYLDDLAAFNKSHFNTTDLWELDMTNNGIDYKINRMYDGCPRMYPAGKDSVAYGWLSPYLITKYEDKYHLRFKDTVMVAGVQMEQEFVYNEADEKFYGVNNAANVISCYPAFSFFTDALAGGHRWQSSVAMEKSDDIQTAISAMITEMANYSIKYEINGSSDKVRYFTFRQSDDALQLSFTLKFKRNKSTVTTELQFVYKIEFVDDNVVLTYQNASNQAATAILPLFPTMQTMLESFNGTYRIAGRDNSYGLRNLRLTSTADANHWFDLQYIN